MSVRTEFGKQEKRKSYTGAQSNQPFLDNLPDGGKFVIDEVYLGSAAAGYIVFLQDGIEKGPRIYVGANDTIPLGDGHFIIFTKGNEVNITSTIAGDHTVFVNYHTEFPTKGGN